jgi:hypothetical protein
LRRLSIGPHDALCGWTSGANQAIAPYELTLRVIAGLDPAIHRFFRKRSDAVFGGYAGA